MPVQIVCKSHKDLIKTRQVMLRTRSNMVFFCNSEVKNLTWPEFKLVLQVTCKSEDDLIKNESTILWTTFSTL